MELFDTHCHIQSSQSQGTAGGEAETRKRWAKIGHPSGDELVARAAEHDVTGMVCVGCTDADSRLAVDFVQSRPQCWASIGIHPHEANGYFTDNKLDESKLKSFAALAQLPKVVAVGECGLDYFYEHSAPAAQAAVLRYQIGLARTNQLPLIFHVREAFDDFWPILEEYIQNGDQIRAVLHSFTDSQANLERALSHGLYIGVNGISTFVKDPAQLAMYQSIPLKNLVLETDSPYLTPSPHRGTICEPYHTSVVARHLSHIRDESLADIATATTVNAHTLFGL